MKAERRLLFRKRLSAPGLRGENILRVWRLEYLKEIQQKRPWRNEFFKLNKKTAYQAKSLKPRKLEPPKLASQA